MINFTGFVIIVLAIGVMAILPFVAAWQGSYINLINDPPANSTTTDPPTTTTWTETSFSITTLTTSTTSLTTSTTTSTSTCQTIQCVSNPYWNQNSQMVADLVVTWGWHSDVQMLADINEPGCYDYVGGLPCDNTMWTTSDNVPTCWTLSSFSYPAIQSSCIAKNTALGAFTQPRDGERYEAYVGSPITNGNACCTHTIMQPSGIDIKCPQTGCSGFSWGSNSQGLYNIQSDAWNGGHSKTPDPNAGVDTAGPQAVNMWLRGNYYLGQLIATNLVQRWDGYGVDVSPYSTWQLGQVMFVMRVYSMDSNSTMLTLDNGQSTSYKNVFAQMVKELWFIQDSQGYLPNTYSSSGRLGGHDPENMDAGLLPFCYNCVMNIRNNFGEFNMNSPPN